MKKNHGKMFIFVLIITVISTMFLAGCSGKTGDSENVGGTNTDSKSQQSNYPTRPIQLIVPYGAGGDTDTNCRMLAKYLTKELGQSVVVSNVTGASGAVGSQQVLDASPDGYTVLFNHPTMLMNTALGLSEFSYKDFDNAGIACIDDANVFVVKADSKYKTLNDVVEDAKANPSKIRFATSMGSFTHLQILALQEQTGTEFNAADMGDMAAYIVALLGNQIEMIGCQYGVVKDYIESGEFRCLGVLSEERNPLISDVPTFKEQGVDISFSKFFFFSFPKGTPTEIIEKFSTAVENVCNNEDYAKEANGVYVTPSYMPPAEAIEYIEKNEKTYEKILENVDL
ncbi:MAG: tripartite tricarboxylate transporter substrate binding protein [Clostridia bacterium]